MSTCDLKHEFVSLSMLIRFPVDCKIKLLYKDIVKIL